MLEELDDYNWAEAFSYAGEPGYGTPDVNSIEEGCSKDFFTREDVKKIYGIQEGENDAEPWRIYGKLKDGRFFYLEAGCDYTGWDCQANGRAWVSSTKRNIIKNGLTEEARRIFGLIKDNVGTIDIKKPTERIDGFTSIIKNK